MNPDIPDDLIEIHDPDIDLDQIMDQIRERIIRRREELGYPRQTFPTFGAAAYPGEPEGIDFDADLYHHLRKANDLYSESGGSKNLCKSVPAPSSLSHDWAE